jgi:hypothetical protein
VGQRCGQRDIGGVGIERGLGFEHDGRSEHQRALVFELGSWGTGADGREADRSLLGFMGGFAFQIETRKWL